jgi:hypothetical protein
VIKKPRFLMRANSQATFSEKLSFAQYAQGCFLANLGYDSESNLALLDVEDCVSRVPLREDCLFPGKGHDFPTLADSGKEFLWNIYGYILRLNLPPCLESSSVSMRRR